MRNKYFWAALFWTLLVTVASLVSNDTFENVDRIELPNKDKFLHFIFYFVFTVLWSSGLNALKIAEARKRRLWAFAIAVVYGMLIEVCQGAFTKERAADITDVLANTAGSAIAILVLWRYHKEK